MQENNYVETIIVGGGQAGLSVARYLKEASRPCLILERNEKLGQSWANRYDSLVLDSFAKYTELEGFPFWGSLWGDPLRHPAKDEVVEYLQTFARHFDLHPQFGVEVVKIEKEENAFLIRTNKGIYHSRFVVLATGPFQKPYIPEFAKEVSSEIYQLHSFDYRNPTQLKSGPSLVVGSGNSGAEIAEELASVGRTVLFSYRRKFQSVESTPFSQWLAYRLGLAHISKDSLLGKIIIWYTKGKSVGVDASSLLKHPNITPVGSFNIEMTKKVANIIWATGYRSDFSIVSIPGFDPELQRRGVTNIPGLFVLNIRWQYSKSSSHLAGISRDAKYIAKYIIKSDA